MRLVLLKLLLVASAALCAAAQPVVVTSCLPLYSWTANIAGSLARVDNLLSSRAEPHDYAFSPGDARRLNAAQLVVVNGLGLESWLNQWLRSDPDRASAKLVTLADGLREQAIRGVTPNLNPHFWLDPKLACIGISNIAAALQRIDPPNAVAYRSNAVGYVDRLRRLDQEIEEGLAPLTNRVIVTYHDAFPYFAKRYNLDVAAVVEEVPDVHPTPRALARIQEVIRARGVKVLYIGSGERSPIAKRIAADLKIELAELDTIEAGELKANAYETRMRANLDVLRRTLR